MQSPLTPSPKTASRVLAGEAFNCSIVFQKAGTIDTEVKVDGLP
jgi:hypothetical protein